MTGDPRRRLRVVHAIQNLNYGGMEKLLADLVRHIDPDRFESHVLTLEYLGRYSEEMQGHATVHAGPEMSRLSLLRPAALARFLAELNPDIVHSHSGVWYKTARAARLAGVQTVMHTEHGQQAEDRLSRFVDRRAARRTDVVVAVSRPLLGYLSQRLGLPPEAMAVVPNGVDTDAFRPRPDPGNIRAELGVEMGQPIIGSIGRLEPVKGYEVVMQAFAELRERCRHLDPVLVVGGEGSARRALEAQVASLGIGDSVFLPGWRDDVHDLYASFDCFVMGSWSEGTSVSLLEAMACGLPPAVTAVGGNLDALGPELKGQLAPSGDPTALAKCIEAAIRPESARPMGAAARARVETTFSLATTVRLYEELYDQAVRSGRYAT